MDKSAEELSFLLQCFPKLSKDPDFRITSPDTPDYNCIAWAYNYSDRWMWPGGIQMKIADGFTYWPDENSSDDVSNFISAFRKKGYELCDSWEHEDGFQKIALYTKQGTTECTHAARELTQGKDCGKWTSKLGRFHDIRHTNPYTIEGDAYGVVHCIMKRVFK